MLGVVQCCCCFKPCIASHYNFSEPTVCAKKEIHYLHVFHMAISEITDKKSCKLCVCSTKCIGKGMFLGGTNYYQLDPI